MRAQPSPDPPFADVEEPGLARGLESVQAGLEGRDLPECIARWQPARPSVPAPPLAKDVAIEGCARWDAWKMARVIARGRSAPKPLPGRHQLAVVARRHQVPSGHP